MKARKVLKRLDKIEDLLSEIIGGFSEASNGASGVGDLLSAARQSILQAHEEVDSLISTPAGRRRKNTGESRRLEGPAAQNKAKTPLAAKKQKTVPKRKAVKSVAPEPLTQTA